MSEVLEDIVNLTQRECSNSEICNLLNISRRELYNYLTILSNLGYVFNRTYHSDGNIIYKLSKYESNNNEILELCTKKYDNSLNVLLTSDWHIDNENTRTDLIEMIPQYCDDNRIHIIFNTGDFISGTFGKGYKNSSILRQIKNFSKVYDTYPNILMFGALGDHDLSGLNTSGINMKKYFSNYRHDIIVDYNNLYLKIKKDIVCLHHHFPKGSRNQKNAIVCFMGHSHKYVSSINADGIFELSVPSLSDLASPIPSMLDVNIEFNNDYIIGLNVKQVIFDSKPEVINEVRHTLIRKKY